MRDQLDENTWRSQPTWDLICEMLGQRHSDTIKAVLRARMEALGALDLFQLVTMEAMYYDTPLPVWVEWDPKIVEAGVTLDEEHFDANVRPLQLKWIAKMQKWAATTVLENHDGRVKTTFGFYATIAEADVAYRALVGLDGARHTEVRVDGERGCRIIVEGHFVPALVEGTPGPE